MTDRSIRATGLIALALAAVLALYSGRQVDRAWRAVAAVAAENQELRARMHALLNSQSKEARELKYLLDRMLEEERERARRARGETWRGRID
jgi:hypothetical protein